MTSGEFFVVPAERHVERLAGSGRHAETRTQLRSRLALALLPDATFADGRECRLVLGIALDDGAKVPRLPSRPAARGKRTATAQNQLDLFGGSGDSPPQDESQASADEEGDPLLEALRARGGASWSRMVDALDTALTVLRARMVTVPHLLTVAKGARGLLAARARTLATAMNALDERLARAKVEDERRVGPRLAAAIAESSGPALAAILGTTRLRARFLYAWDPADIVWWRALDEKLGLLGGYARITLPTFDRPLQGARERDPLEVLADEIARGLDAPPEHEVVRPVLGDLTFTAQSELSGVDPAQVALARVADAGTQARVAVRAAEDALAAGAPLERIAFALPVADERTLLPLRRGLEEAGIVAYESRGAPPSEAPVVAAALLALEVALTLERSAVARLLESGYVDAAALAVEGTDRAQAFRAMGRIAGRLIGSATAAGSDAPSRFLRTVAHEASPMLRARGPVDEEDRARERAMAERLATVLFREDAEASRADHVRHARRVWSELGIGSRAGRGGLRAFARDDAPRAVMRAERLAIARDTRAWDTLSTVLDLYESTVQRSGETEVRVPGDVFRQELAELLDDSASRPGAGRAGAVRIVRLADVAGDELDLLVVLDANEGLLPRDEAHDALVSDALWSALADLPGGARGWTPVTAPSGEERRARELTQLASGADGAGKILVISLREDASGAPFAPSPVVTALERAGIVTSAEAPRVAPAIADPALFTRIVRERTREGFFLDPKRVESEVVGRLAAPELAKSLLEHATGGSARPLAVTSLERFARCAFMGYAHAVLHVREAERHDELPDAREEGTVVHDALAAAFVATRELWPARPRDAERIVVIGLAASDAVLASWEGHAPLRAVHRLRVRDAVRAVLQAALADDEWDFALAEQPFGARTAGGWPPYVLHAQEGAEAHRLALRGTIDRVDQAHSGKALRVVDYKRSKNTVRSSLAALGETALQVPLYARVSEGALGKPATGTYLPFQPRDVRDAKTSPKAQKRMDDLLARTPNEPNTPIDRAALGLVILARRANFAPVPASESECLYCAVSGGCRKPRFAMAPQDDDESEGGS